LTSFAASTDAFSAVDSARAADQPFPEFAFPSFTPQSFSAFTDDYKVTCGYLRKQIIEVPLPIRDASSHSG
jgi:hypothetical protein